jgi:hypothetical protein
MLQAGSGNIVGSRFEELADIISRVDGKINSYCQFK